MSATNSTITLAAKVDHLGNPDSYAERPDCVETRETHMSWVFLAGGLAYKLKKPIKSSFDWGSVELRREDCEREVRLNRRLARDVYYGIVPLTIDTRGDLHLEGDGEPADWLVKMRRLPESLMLDWLIERNRVDMEDFRRALKMLCQFYRRSPAFEILARQYRRRLEEDLAQSCRELLLPKYGQSDALVRRVHKTLSDYVHHHTPLAPNGKSPR